MHDLYQHMKKQERMIERLATRVDQVEKSIQDKNSQTIEKIEYKFDQLKIEHLDGTLHIGMSPGDLANLDGLDMHQPQQPNYPPLKQTLTSELNGYLQDNGPSIIRDLANQRHFTIDEGYQSILLADIAKQLPERVAFYEQEARRNNKPGTEDQLRFYITDQIKKEINQSLINYMQKNEQKGEET